MSGTCLRVAPQADGESSDKPGVDTQRYTAEGRIFDEPQERSPAYGTGVIGSTSVQQTTT